MNAFTTYAVYCNNRPIHDQIFIDFKGDGQALKRAIETADFFKGCFPVNDFTVLDVTADSFTKTVYTAEKKEVKK